MTMHDPYSRPEDPIERDAMFGGWSRDLPRLWYLDQRQATRLDAESLYGATMFAVFQSRTMDETLATPVDTVTILGRTYVREVFEHPGFPADSYTRTLSLTRTLVEVLEPPIDEAIKVRPSTSPVSPPVHNIPADEK
jgi:hypothetical protein